MRLRTWAGSIIDTRDYGWRVWPRWACGWFLRGLRHRSALSWSLTVMNVACVIFTIALGDGRGWYVTAVQAGFAGGLIAGYTMGALRE